MGKYTSKLNLYKVDPTLDGKETFNIKTMLNDNWDKVDNKVKSMNDKLDNIENNANNYTHPSNHPADMVTVRDVRGDFSCQNVEDVLGEIGASMSAIANYDFEMKNKDANGIYQDFEEYRDDDTLFRKTTLSNPDVNGNYHTETQIKYDTDGTTVLNTRTFTLKYNDDNKLYKRDEVIV